MLVSKSRVLIELHLNLGFLKIGLIKPHMVQNNQRILSFRNGFMVNLKAIELGFRINPNKLSWLV